MIKITSIYGVLETQISRLARNLIEPGDQVQGLHLTDIARLMGVSYSTLRLGSRSGVSPEDLCRDPSHSVIFTSMRDLGVIGQEFIG